LLPAIRIDLDISPEKVALEWHFYLIWKAKLWRNFGVPVGQAACEACDATLNLGTNSAFALGRRNHEKPHSIGPGAELSGSRPAMYTWILTLFHIRLLLYLTDY
jgi:hypothetical protein